jgi:plastocyanin
MMHDIRFSTHAVAAATLVATTLAFCRSARADEGTVAGQVSAPNPKQRAGVVVSLEKVPGNFTPPGTAVQMDQRGMQFIPHVLAVLKGTEVKFQNSDAVSHNVFTPDGDKYNLGNWGKGQSKTHNFDKPGVYRQLCNVHPEMSAVIVVLDNPFFAVTGEDGKYKIEHVPPGTYSLNAWSEKLPAAKQSVTVTAGQAATADVALKR